MGNDDEGDAVQMGREFFKCRSDFAFCGVVQCGCGLVKEEHFRLLVQGTGYANALFLSTGKPASVFAQGSVNAFGQGLCPCVKVYLLKHFAYLLSVDVFLPQCNVFCQRTVNDEYVLRNISHKFVPRSPALWCKRCAVYANFSAGGREKA